MNFFLYISSTAFAIGGLYLFTFASPPSQQSLDSQIKSAVQLSDSCQSFCNESEFWNAVNHSSENVSISNFTTEEIGQAQRSISEYKLKLDLLRDTGLILVDIYVSIADGEIRRVENSINLLKHRERAKSQLNALKKIQSDRINEIAKHLPGYRNSPLFGTLDLINNVELLKARLENVQITTRRLGGGSYSRGSTKSGLVQWEYELKRIDSDISSAQQTYDPVKKAIHILNAIKHIDSIEEELDEMPSSRNPGFPRLPQIPRTPRFP